MRAALLVFVLFFSLMTQAVDKFIINMERVKLTSKGNFAESKTYLIPTVYLRLTARTQTEISTEGASGATVKAKIIVEGLDKKMLQALTQKVSDDLAAKITAAGFKVLTYKDVKEDLKSLDRMKVNERFGFPTNLLEGGAGVDFAIITPSDEQNFDYGFSGITFPYRELAKKKNIEVIVPDVRLTISEVTGDGLANSFKVSVKMDILPSLKLDQVQVHALAPDLSTGNILIQTHVKRLVSDSVGALKKVSEESNSYVGWARTVGDFVFTVNPEALSNGVLNVTSAVNDLTAKTIKEAH